MIEKSFVQTHIGFDSKTSARQFSYFKPAAAAISSTSSGRSLGGILTMSLSISFVATIVALLLEAVSNPSAPLNRIAGHFIHSFAYSNCIGILLGISILGLTPRPIF